MPLPLLNDAYFLQSLGWAIAHSFWQAGLLWFIYAAIIAKNKQLSALVKYQFGVGLILSIFAWFVFTIIGNYQVLANSGTEVSLLSSAKWIAPLQSLNHTLPFLSILYFSLLAIHAISFTLKLVSNYRLQVSGLSKAPLDLRLFTNRTALHLGIRRTVKVCMSANVDVPSVTGFLKPVILLPFALVSHLSTHQVEAILLHELAHIKRNDYLVNLFQSIIELLMFFNPFVVLLSKRISKERENCCDDWVMNFRFNKYDYASALLRLEEQRHENPGFALAATNNRKTLLERIKRLFATEPQTSLSLDHRIKMAATYAFILAGIFIALPTMWRTQHAETVKVKISLPRPAIDVSPAAARGPELAKTILYVAPASLTPDVIAEKPEPKSKIIKRKSYPARKPATEQVYVDALINEELLSPASEAETLAILAAQSETGIDSTKTYFIKIEEQQSGEKSSQSYVFKLEDKAGSASIKPLIMLNKTKIPAKKAVKKPAVKNSSPRKVRTTS